jgi:hypothetical protein
MAVSVPDLGCLVKIQAESTSDVLSFYSDAGDTNEAKNGLHHSPVAQYLSAGFASLKLRESDAGREHYCSAHGVQPPGKC